MHRILLTHTPETLHKYYGPKAVAALQAIAEVRFNHLDRELTLDELVAASRDCQIIISYRQTAAPAQLFRMLPDLLAFLRCAIDIRNIDVAAASAQGILVANASAAEFMVSVSEWTIGAMIDLSRGLTRAAEAYHAGTVPGTEMGRELRGSALGVIGYGQISRTLCRFAAAFEMRILVCDPYAVTQEAGIERVNLPELLAAADYVVCLAIANDSTENLMNDACFSAMKRGAFFINPSRGNLVDEAALLRALDGGRLAGCAMDVGRAPDQMPSPALARHPLVIATPHIGGLTPAAIGPKALESVEQAAAVLQGRIPVGAINAAHATRLARRIDQPSEGSKP